QTGFHFARPRRSRWPAPTRSPDTMEESLFPPPGITASHDPLADPPVELGGSEIKRRHHSRPSRNRKATKSARVSTANSRFTVRLSVREGIDDLVDLHAVRHRGVLNVARILYGVGPLPAVAHVGVPVEQ